MIQFIVWYISIGLAGAMLMGFYGFVLDWMEILILTIAWPYFVVSALLDEVLE